MWRRTSRQILQTKVSTWHIHICFLHSNTEYRLDLHEDSEKNVVTATFELPGFSKDEVQINVQSRNLTVSAETKKSTKHNADTGYTLTERLHGKFSRTLQLPQGVQVCYSFLNLREWMITDDYRCTGWTNQSDHGRWSLDRLVPKDLAWTRGKEDCDPDIR